MILKNKTLVEYYVPSQNTIYGLILQIHLVLRLIIMDRYGLQSGAENKLGVFTKDRLDQIPITLGVSKDKLVLDSKNNKSDVIDIYIHENILNASKIIIYLVTRLQIA